MSKIDLAEKIFRERLSCSQAILATYGPQLGLDWETAIKVSSAFGGGMSRTGVVCGAVTGALMVIGLTSDVNDITAKDKVYDQSQVFCTQFKERHGSICCKDLLGYDISTPEGRSMIKEKNLPQTICACFVRDAAEILETLLPD